MNVLLPLGYQGAFSTTLTNSLEKLQLELKNYNPIEKNATSINRRKFFL